MNSFIKTLMLFTVLISPWAKASVIVDGTRYVFNGDKTEAALAVENKDKNVNLVQSWVEPADKDIIPDAFVITPPLFRLGAGERNTLRIIREASVYLLIGNPNIGLILKASQHQ